MHFHNLLDCEPRFKNFDKLLDCEPQFSQMCQSYIQTQQSSYVPPHLHNKATTTINSSLGYKPQMNFVPQQQYPNYSRIPTMSGQVQVLVQHSQLHHNSLPQQQYHHSGIPTTSYSLAQVHFPVQHNQLAYQTTGKSSIIYQDPTSTSGTFYSLFVFLFFA